MSVMEAPDALDDIIEAALLSAGEPLGLDRLELLFDDHERPPRRALREALERLTERHVRGAMELIETASGYQLRIRPRLANWVARLWDERPQRYSRALLETLAMIAYRQPVTRGDIEEVRGVTVSGSIMRTLLERGWIRVVGHRDVPGRPAVYATTRSFLDDFGLKTLDELPPMHELKQFEEVQLEEDLPPPPSPLLAQADLPLDEELSGEASSGEVSSDEEPSESEDQKTAAMRTEAQEAEEVEGGVDSDTKSESSTNIEDRTRIESLVAVSHDDETRFSIEARGASGTEAAMEASDMMSEGLDGHAEMASERTGLSFADLEARLSERARGRVDDDAASGTEYTDTENDTDE
ncbi:SMC-Scp complex subunit ScpB [Halomonas sp. Y2R2]|uniref:SMC-Scp complex subunit ScpB n=1 Tax=Halomonas binhaiensis TaxID=2562282 RepID=A0A5C1NLC4_9GAMM|nr:SMC-Scp complex subunit ScpB [Halomonas binhaiensis]